MNVPRKHVEAGPGGQPSGLGVPRRPCIDFHVMTRFWKMFADTESSRTGTIVCTLGVQDAPGVSVAVAATTDIMTLER